VLPFTGRTQVPADYVREVDVVAVARVLWGRLFANPPDDEPLRIFDVHARLAV